MAFFEVNNIMTKTFCRSSNIADIKDNSPHFKSMVPEETGKRTQCGTLKNLNNKTFSRIRHLLILLYIMIATENLVEFVKI